MTVTIFLVRGINVGGHNRLPMADLRDAALAAGAETARTYLQSGNLVTRGAVSVQVLSAQIARRAAIEPLIQSRSLADWEALIAANPYPEVSDHKALHLFCFSGRSAATSDQMTREAGPEERVQVVPGAVYLHTPKHLSGSKIAARMDRLVGRPTTARNWRSVEAIRDLARGLAR